MFFSSFVCDLWNRVKWLDKNCEYCLDCNVYVRELFIFWVGGGVWR